MPNRDGVSLKAGGVTLPPLPPASAFSNNQSLRQLYSQFRDIIGTLKTQRVQIGSSYADTLAALQEQQRNSLYDESNNAIERGVLGSSGDFGSRLKIKGAVATQAAQAMNTRDQSLLANRAQALQALRDLSSGALSVQENAAAQQSALNLQDFLNNAFNTPNGGGKGKGVGPGGLPPAVDNRGSGLADLTTIETHLSDLFRSYVAAPNSKRGGILSSLRDAWAARNRVRKAAGLSTFGWNVFESVLQGWLNPSPGGGGGGGPEFK